MKFVVTYLKEVTDTIQADDMDGAAFAAAARVSRESNMKVLYILEVKESAPAPAPKPPTPFGRPPGGTLGGGKIQKEVVLVDQVAVAA